jgi:hypothetical protein
MTDIKNLLFFILLGGKGIKQEQLLTMFAELADLSDLSHQNDLKDVGLNYTTMFAEKSYNMFQMEDFDEWIQYYKNELLKTENYELINYLEF